jgi:hypothetical protein
MLIPVYVSCAQRDTSTVLCQGGRLFDVDMAYSFLPSFLPFSSFSFSFYLPAAQQEDRASISHIASQNSGQPCVL